MFIIATFLATCAPDQDEERSPSTLLVGVKPAAPFVMIDNVSGHVSGVSIDLIRAIATQMDPPRTVEFRVHREIAEHLAAVRGSKVDLGIAATS
jgi:hypothetical protein